VRLTFVLALGIICSLSACAGPPAAPTPTPVRTTAPAATVGDCGPAGARPSGPELERAVLARFSAENSSPYRNARTAAVSDDGTFARVMLCVDLRPSTTVDWEPYLREYDLANVGGVWRVQSSGQLTTVRARATDEAAQALAAGISVEVVRIEVVDVKSGFSTYRSVQPTLRWSSADQRPHTVQYQLSFEALGHGCLDSSFARPKDATPIDARMRIVPSAPIGSTGEVDLKARADEETVPNERTYSANTFSTGLASLECASYSDPANVQLVVTAIDGVFVRRR